MVDISTRKGLHRLLYYSAASHRFPTAAAEQDAEIAQIVLTSVTHNSAAGVTGLLLVHQNWFLQTLEGPAEAVMTTYGRILSDQRHEAPTIIEAAPAQERLFSVWNMCARRLHRADDAILSTLDLKGVFEPRKLSGAKALALLTAVRNIRSRVAAAAAA